MTTRYYKQAWSVAIAALAINLILGILYSWSIFQKALVERWEWSNTEASLPYTITLATFAATMIFAGRAQDKFGPRKIAFIGGVIFGAGLILSSFTQSPAIMMITFGLAGGMGLGFGYSAVTPSAIKWFPAEKKGLISGIVVSGVGLSPVYIAPLTSWFINNYSIEQAFLFLGIVALVGISLLSLLLKNPPEGSNSNHSAVRSVNTTKLNSEYSWNMMIRTRSFFLLWLTFLMSGAAGLMLIGHMARIAFVQAGWQAGFVLVVILSIFNALGRVIGGELSDRTGRTNAMLIVFVIQAINIFMFIFYQSIPSLIAGSIIAGLAYGALFSLFPAITADYFGMKNLGVNYGLIFSGWGIAGIIGPVIAGVVADSTGEYTISYIISAIMLLGAAILIKRVKPPQ